MCGFAGEVRRHGAPDEAALARMQEVLRPRGPDGAGLRIEGRVGLAHRRLAIIDLSETGAQPMVDAALGLSVVFNGCIYNHLALRRALEAAGHVFASASDTEVLLKGWAEWGEGLLDRLVGMFAFALHEHGSGRVILARDRLGIKPLYLCERPDGGLRFASSLPALVAGGGVDTSVDPVALHHYLSFHSIVPPPRTILRGVAKLPPATLLVLEPDGRRRERRWWDPSFARDPERAAGGGGVGGGAARRPARRRRPADGGRRPGRRAAVRRAGLLDHRRAARARRPAPSRHLLDRLPGRGRPRGGRVRVLRPRGARVRHGPPPDPRRGGPPGGRAPRGDRGHGRADDLPRRGGLLPAQRAGGARPQGRPVRPGRRRGAGRLLLVPAAARGPRRRAGHLRGELLRPRPRRRGGAGGARAPARGGPEPRLRGGTSAPRWPPRRWTAACGSTRRSCWSTTRSSAWTP